jgi:hypothetical protein
MTHFCSSSRCLAFLALAKLDMEPLRDDLGEALDGPATAAAETLLPPACLEGLKAPVVWSSQFGGEVVTEGLELANLLRTARGGGTSISGHNDAKLVCEVALQTMMRYD